MVIRPLIPLRLTSVENIRVAQFFSLFYFSAKVQNSILQTFESLNFGAKITHIKYLNSWFWPKKGTQNPENTYLISSLQLDLKSSSHPNTDLWPDGVYAHENYSPNFRNDDDADQGHYQQRID